MPLDHGGDVLAVTFAIRLSDRHSPVLVEQGPRPFTRVVTVGGSSFVATINTHSGPTTAQFVRDALFWIQSRRWPSSTAILWEA